MWLYIVAVIMLIVGGAALILGKFKLTKKIALTGWWARVAGLLLVAPLPLSLLARTSPYSQPSDSGWPEFLYVFAGLGGTLIWIFIHRLKNIIAVHNSGIATEDGFTGKTVVACVALVLGLLCTGSNFLVGMGGSSAFAMYRGLLCGGVLLLIALALVGL
jgi:hypothetical protein